MQNRLHHQLLFAALLIIFIWSGINPADRFTWYLEVFPVIIGVPILIYIYPRFRFTNLTYVLILIHASILMIGGHYTYAEMPLFNWIRDTFDLSRNYYDRLGHLAQGFIPAMLVREILIRKSPVKKGPWLPFIVICICLSISAMYELLEFAVAMITGTVAEAFLGTQGDVWDTQWDMTFALVGAIASLTFLSRVHDRQMGR